MMEGLVRTRQPIKQIRVTSEYGARRVIVEFQGIIRDLSDPDVLLPVDGAIDFEFDNGEPVQQRNDGLFISVLTDEVFVAEDCSLNAHPGSLTLAFASCSHQSDHFPRTRKADS
jgi:hypothetical protein